MKNTKKQINKKKLNKTIAIIGEGITEKYYIESLKGISPFQIQPKSLDKKASNLKELEKNINSSIKDGFDEIFCLIDMDVKTLEPTKRKYEELKNKFHNKIFNIKSKAIESKVIFIETERCLELWFLYHFIFTTKKFDSYNQLEQELKKYIPNYNKSKKYFETLYKGINKDFENNNGSLQKAIKNSEKSCKSKDERKHTYSEMHILMKAIGFNKLKDELEIIK